ncbi:L,D-transpeptidase family protein [Aliarcobacter cibarius]|jgi:L,D-transpeptidase YcbB|uniref:Murein L,D-transpeptidase n=1 Tax=Aliarcobacter cibarius TaxID=255507 RepID=A0A5J6RG96_9BACT|nr:L,D-transpeptidase family protein [Aliarcobacter cibarius]QEZ88905.1 murein L,D-transpeptidase, YcbB/YkuD family [Aliarcobacter cibarius]QKJ26949.1 murein L,D-transpeptidase, YcbB/YkuD family [Aliarcobacter cibarius]TLS97773.1 murein L,D-transpeptidase [Aliarcobacter cibarius]TLS98527.1 murein L,D-transpeptidase [Aliarcobacter cibarius]TLT03029.1 murein L,D-transpeptidase [Aliarcobacter cibarius]
MLNFKFMISILLLNSYLFSSSINLDLKNYLNKDANSTLVKIDRLKNYYSNNDAKTYWIDKSGIKSISLEFINLVKNDPVYKPNVNKLFKIDELEEKISKLDKSNHSYNKDLFDIEILLTQIYDKYTNYLLKGSINWQAFQEKLKELKLKDIDAQWDRDLVKKDNKQILKEIIEKNDVSIISEKIDTNFPNKKELEDSILALEKIIKSGDYKKLPPFKTLRIGDYGENVKFLRERLFQSNNLQTACKNSVNIENLVTNSVNTEENTNKEEIKENEVIKTISCEEYFDEDLKNAVISFQKQHGLLADGIVGPSTQTFLNKSAKEKINQIRLNIERMRWLPRDFGEKYLLINIPEYNLKIIEKNEIKLNMPVIVGDVKYPTPIFSDKMSYIVLNPTWNIPSSIIKKEVIPKLMEDPNYLNTKEITAFNNWRDESEPVNNKDLIDSIILENPEALEGLRLTQAPGTQNPLGKMKFMFPNKHSVYLHDTPNKYLFANSRRAYSHGCIRLSKPNELLNILSEDNQNIDQNKVTEILKDNKEKSIGLNQKLPIHIIYLTSWVDENGTLQFREDIYNYDKIQKELLF